MKCGHCKEDHQCVDEVRVCAEEHHQFPPSRASTLTQIANHGRAQSTPYDPERKAAEASVRRANPTPPEKRLEEALRADGSMKFKREEKIYGYFVDFFFPEARTIVEVDGSTFHRGQTVRDGLRDDVLRANWYQVMRFSASEVTSAPESVIAQIAAVVKPLQDQHQNRIRQARNSLDINGSRAASVRRREQERKERALKRKKKEKERHYEQNRPTRSAKIQQSRFEEKFKFRCTSCEREFVTTRDPWPQCRKCPELPPVELICSGRGCGKALSEDIAYRFCYRCDPHCREIRGSLHGGVSEFWKTGRHSKGI